MSEVLKKLEQLHEAIEKMSGKELIALIKNANISKEESSQYAPLEQYIFGSNQEQSITKNILDTVERQSIQTFFILYGISS